MKNKDFSKKTIYSFILYFFIIGVIFSFLVITFLIFVVKLETTTYWKWWDSVDYSWEMLYVITPILPLFLIYPFLNATKQIVKQKEEISLETSKIILMIFGVLMIIVSSIVIFILPLYEFPLGPDFPFLISQFLIVISFIVKIDIVSKNNFLKTTTFNFKNIIALSLFIIICVFGYILHEELIDIFALAIIMIVIWYLSIILFLIDLIILLKTLRFSLRKEKLKILKNQDFFSILVLYVLIGVCNGLYIYSNFFTRIDPYLEYPINSLYLMVGFNLLLLIFILFFYFRKTEKNGKKQKEK